MTAGIFPPEVIEAACASRERWDVPASVCLAQWALESGWGRAMPPGSNNPFGIKALPGQPAVTAMTREMIDGRDVRLPQQFRMFADLAEAFDAHGRLLANGAAYAAARAVRHDARAFAQALQGHYATDPNYAAELLAIMDQHALLRFDRTPAGPIAHDISWVQTTLNRLGARPRLAVDGTCSPPTREAIRAFQASHGLLQDGAVTAATLTALEQALAASSRVPVPPPPKRRRPLVMLTNKWLQFGLSALMTVLAGSASLDWSAIVSPSHAAGIATGIAAVKAVLNLLAPGPGVPVQPTGGTIVTHSEV